jgi:polyhydroxyalkanoate synthesis regulator phasin
MNFHKPSQTLGQSFVVLIASLLLLQLKCDASPAQQQEQQQSQSQQSPPPAQNSQPASQQTPPPDQPAAKQKKVWTEEDVILLRTPADNYQVEKEARGAAEAEAARKAAAKPEKEPPLDIKLPATLEETEKVLKSAQDDIQEEAVILDKLQKELLDAPAEQKAEKQKEVDRLTASLETLRRDVKALQDHLQTFPVKPQGENPPAAPQPPAN